VGEVENNYFAADLSIYSGNSGSPVFNQKTHEVIGIVVCGDSKDFRWTGNGWLSIIYPGNTPSPKPQCARLSQFMDIVEKLR
jgi:hypothetical protein